MKHRKFLSMSSSLRITDHVCSFPSIQYVGSGTALSRTFHYWKPWSWSHLSNTCQGSILSTFPLEPKHRPTLLFLCTPPTDIEPSISQHLDFPKRGSPVSKVMTVSPTSNCFVLPWEDKPHYPLWIDKETVAQIFLSKIMGRSYGSSSLCFSH